MNHISAQAALERTYDTYIYGPEIIAALGKWQARSWWSRQRSEAPGTRESHGRIVLADVCAVLGLANASMMAGRLDDDGKGVSTTDTPGGPQQMAIINGSGLYSTILTSRKEGARRFKKWVTGEVLPSIRKDGGYMLAAPAGLALRRDRPESRKARDRCPGAFHSAFLVFDSSVAGQSGASQRPPRGTTRVAASPGPYINVRVARRKRAELAPDRIGSLARPP